jgi:lipopolysaccharide biosynthesis regulator YciM
VETLFEYRNPLFGVLILCIIVAIVAFTNYWLIIQKRKKEKNRVSSLINSFNFANDQVDYSTLIDNYKVPIEILELIAHTYYKSGDYEKAINIYLKLLNIVNDRTKKESIMYSLGITYFRAGFLQRSKSIFLRTLEIYPRNVKALNYLLIIYERLNEYHKAEEVIEPLEELNVDTKNIKEYLKVMNIINDSLLEYEDKKDKLIKILDKNHNLNRLICEYLSKIDKDRFWQTVSKYYSDNLLDLLWYIDTKIIDYDIIESHDRLSQIYTAKGILRDNNITSDHFELSILIDLQKTKNLKATLSFEYICKECKHIFPIYAPRCPNCHSILSLDTEAIIEKKAYIEKSESLL